MRKPNLLFPTPVWTIQLDNYKVINEEMYNFIKSEQIKDKIGINKSNVKGWHSKNFVLERDHPQKVISFILPAIEQVMIDMNWEKEKQLVKIDNMWAIINTGGAANLDISMEIVQLVALTIWAQRIVVILFFMILDLHQCIHILTQRHQIF